ncbi:hypothetical protein SRIMM317S_05737 [Streptomyces rimosus subsp. rimosus]
MTPSPASPATAAAPALPVQPPQGCPFDPPAEFARLRTEAPLSKISLPDGTEAWLATRYADIRAILGDTRFSSDTTRPGYPLSGMTGGATTEHRGFIRMDPPEHTRLRRMVTREFMVKRVEAMRPEIQRRDRRPVRRHGEARRPGRGPGRGAGAAGAVARHQPAARRSVRRSRAVPGG